MFAFCLVDWRLRCCERRSSRTRIRANCSNEADHLRDGILRWDFDAQVDRGRHHVSFRCLHAFLLTKIWKVPSDHSSPFFMDDLSPIFCYEQDVGLTLPTVLRHRLELFHEIFLLRLAGLFRERAYSFTLDRQSLPSSHGPRPCDEGILSNGRAFSLIPFRETYGSPATSPTEPTRPPVADSRPASRKESVWRRLLAHSRPIVCSDLQATDAAISSSLELRTANWNSRNLFLEFRLRRTFGKTQSISRTAGA